MRPFRGTRALTAEQVELVRMSDKPKAVLAREFGVNRGTILKIVHDSYAPAPKYIPPDDGADWRPVAGYERKYEICRDGRVRNCLTGAVLSAPPGARGYVTVQLFRAGERKPRSFRIHRLVALAFIPNPEGKPEVNHIDLDKSHNDASNLEWATPKENRGHAARMGLSHAGTNPRQVRVHSVETVAAMKAAFSNGESVSAIARRFNISSGYLWKILHGKKRIFG